MAKSFFFDLNEVYIRYWNCPNLTLFSETNMSITKLSHKKHSCHKNIKDFHFRVEIWSFVDTKWNSFTLLTKKLNVNKRFITDQFWWNSQVTVFFLFFWFQKKLLKTKLFFILVEKSDMESGLFDQIFEIFSFEIWWVAEVQFV